MIFLDASFVLRGLVRAVTAQDQAMAQEVSALWQRAQRGEVELTTSDEVLAEIAFVLNSPRQYNVSPADIAARLKPLLRLHSLHLP